MVMSLNHLPFSHSGVTQVTLSQDPDALMNEHEYAALRGCSVGQIRAERLRGGGCQFLKIGRSVRYKRRTVIEWLDRHTVSSTTEADTVSPAK